MTRLTSFVVSLCSLFLVSGAALAQRQSVHVVTPHGVDQWSGSVSAVKDSVKSDMRLDVVGRPTGGGSATYGAAYQTLVLKNGRATTLRAGQYSESPHVDRPQQLRVSGVPGGLLKAIHLGTTSAHDIAGKHADIEKRAREDLVRIAFDRGGGAQTELVTRGASGHVSEHEIEIPLSKTGPTRVLYERQNQAGRVVGGIGGYMMGRVLEILWDGTEQ